MMDALTVTVRIATALLAVGALQPAPCQAETFVVGRDAPGVQAALDGAKAGDIVEVPSGIWAGSVVVRAAVVLRGTGGMIDGGGEGTVVRVEAPGAIVEELTIFHSGDDLRGPDSGIYVTKSAAGAVLRNNSIKQCAFGIWIHETPGAQVIGNRVHGRPELRMTDRGNGIHLFNASNLVVRGNFVTEARDGIYVAATEDSLIENNRTERLRYGFHYMFSYRNTLKGNVSDDSTVGLALMESKELVVIGNRATGNERNGLLFRDVQRSTIRRNVLEHNGSGMFFFSSTDNVIEDNRVAHNEVGMKIWAGTRRNRISRNVILGNRQQVFYVGAEDQIWGQDSQGNYWGDYLGWDQNGDGVGDRPHRVDSFKASLLYRYPSAVLLLRSPAMEMLAHLAESLPLLRVPTVVDVSPLAMKEGP